MPKFPHLKLPFKLEGATKPGRAFPKAQPLTTQNKENRQAHGQYLQRSAADLIDWWDEVKSERQGESLPNPNDIPVFLKVDTEVFDIDSIRNWGIDLVSEEEDGFIIGASTDNFEKFSANVEQFLNEAGQRKDKAAQIWEVVTGEEWRIEKLLDAELLAKWEEIADGTEYTVELGVSCQSPITKQYPRRSDFESEEVFEEKVEAFKTHELEIALDRDAKQMERESEIESYVRMYDGELHQIWSNEEDAVYFKISISGRGLRDIVQTYQYLFEVREGSTIAVIEQQWRGGEDIEIEIVPPLETAPRVCVIDSGIQEGHPLLIHAIDSAASRSYVDGDASTADYVRTAGHGTKVAGAVLFPISIPRNGSVDLLCWLQNARILDRDNRLPRSSFEPTLMEQIVSDYEGTRIFNLSVNSYQAYVGTHMSPWAASLDKLTHENDVLFVVCTGNIPDKSVWTRSLGIREHIAAGRDYPAYLSRSGSKIANPAISLFSLSVGSIAREDFEDTDYKSLAGKDFVSPFSRVGPGLWGSIKPDVVEFGGDYAKAKASGELIVNDSISPELVNSTLYGANSIGRDDCGTSYSAPKVSHIVAQLQAEHPDESAQMYRALVVQSARLPQHCFENPTPDDFQHYGYGVADVNRAIGNSPGRITFIQSGSVGPREADIYRLKIPELLRENPLDPRILVEVTLAFTAKTRLTRKGSHSYLSSWLEWKSSKYNEGFQSFRNRTLNYLDENGDEFELEDEGGAIQWVIRENPNWGSAGINRNNSTVQKSWAIIEPNQFAEEFNLAVVGHAGWDRNLENETEYSLAVSFEVLDQQLNVYELLSEAQVEIEGEQEVEV